MNATDSIQKARLLTATESGAAIKIFREMRQWSQEQLAAISGLNVRTIQRIEQGAQGSLDTRRALASVFDFEDIDVLSQPFTVPTTEDMQAAKEKFDRENISLVAHPLTTGKQLAHLVESCTMDMSEAAFELAREADEAFASLIDYFREYRDCVDLYSESQKFAVYDELQSSIDSLRTLGVSLCYAVRTVQLTLGEAFECEPMPTTALYVVAFPFGKEPTEFATPKSVGVRL